MIQYKYQLKSKEINQMKQYKLLPYGERIPGHKSAQAQVVKVDGTASLFSYTTLVAHLDTEGWLKVAGLYSVTTSKHIRWFLKEYCKNEDGIRPGFETIKLCVEDKLQYNIHTGEVRPW
jgi:hypothetical protein